MKILRTMNHKLKFIKGQFMNKLRILYSLSKAKKLTIILATYFSIILYRLIMIFIIHYNNVYEFKIEKFEAHKMEIFCGFKDAISPLNISIEDMKIEIFSHDFQKKNEAAVFSLKKIKIEKSENLALKSAKLHIDRINNSLLFEILTKKKPNIIFKVKAKIAPRFIGIWFQGLNLERQVKLCLDNANIPPTCSMCKNLKLNGEDNGEAAISVTIDKEYFDFPSWFNLISEKSTLIFKNPKIYVSVDPIEIVNGLIQNDIQCNIKASNEIKHDIMQKKKSINLEIHRYCGSNKYFKMFFQHLTINLDLNNNGDYEFSNTNNATYYIKMINYDAKVLTLDVKIEDNAKLNYFLQQFQDFKGTGIKFNGKFNNEEHIIDINVDFVHNSSISARLKIKILDIKRFIEFCFFRRSYLSIVFAEQSIFRKFFGCSCLVIDAHGMFEIVDDITKFSYSEEIKRREAIEIREYDKNIIYEFQHFCTSQEDHFSVYSTLSLGSYIGTQSYIIFEFDDEMTLIAETEIMTVFFKIGRNSKIDIKHPNMINDKIQESVPFLNLLTGQLKTEIKIVINEKIRSSGLSNSPEYQRFDDFNFDNIKCKIEAIKKAFFPENQEIDFEGCKFDFNYILDLGRAQDNKEKQTRAENLNILDLTNCTINKNIIEINLSNISENDVNHNFFSETKGNNTINFENSHIIRHKLNIEREMRFGLFNSVLGILKIKPCIIDFVTSKNGVCNIRCSENIQIIINEKLNLYELIHHIKRINKNSIILASDSQSISKFVTRVFKAFIFMDSEKKYNNIFLGQSSLDLNLQSQNDMIIFDFSLQFCKIIKSNLENLHKSVKIEIPAYNLLFENNVGFIEFSGLSFYYDNATKRVSISDVKLCIKIDAKAVNQQKLFKIYLQKKDLANAIKYPTQFFCLAHFSKSFDQGNVIINSDYDDIDSQIILDEAHIEKNDDYDLLKCNGKLSDKNLYLFMDKLERLLFSFFQFRPKYFLFNLNVENIPLFTVISDGRQLKPVTIQKITLHKRILDFHEKKDSYLKFCFEIVFDTQSVPIQNQIDFLQSEFMTFLVENQKLKNFSKKQTPLICFYSHLIPNYDLLLIRLEKVVKCNIKIHLAYTNSANRTFIISLFNQKEHENFYWFIGKFYDNNKESYTDYLAFWRFFMKNDKKQYFSIFINNEKAYTITLIDPQIGNVPRRSIAFFLQTYKLLNFHISKFIVNNVFYYLCDNILYKDPPYSVEEFKHESKLMDEIYVQCEETQ